MTIDEILAYFLENRCIYGVVECNLYGHWFCKWCYRFDDLCEDYDWLDFVNDNGYTGKLTTKYVALNWRSEDKIKTITAKEFMQSYKFD